MNKRVEKDLALREDIAVLQRDIEREAAEKARREAAVTQQLAELSTSRVSHREPDHQIAN